jgi:4-amino-4-deoxy-L-arabinose transferase-like glycosyltransferase
MEKTAKYNISKFAIALILLVCAWYGANLDTWGKNQIIKDDVVSYYAYLPAAFIFNDLDFEFIKNLPEDFEGTIWVQTAPNGKPLLRMTMGMAMLWTPFFLIAHGVAHILGVSTLGYSWPYSLSIFIATLFYLFVGLYFLRKILLRYFSDVTMAVVLILVVLATNLMYYVISEPGMTHVYNFGLITAFMYLTIKWLDKPNLKYSVILGLLAGIIVLIRPVNIIVLLFPALIGIRSFSDFWERIAKNWRLILIAGIAAFLVIVPQLLYWKSQTGHFIFNSYMDQGKFYFLKPQIINGLFSYRKGWLLYTPVMVFAFLGFFWIKKYTANLVLPIVVFLVIDIYVVYSWWCWWYGGSFGSRPMVDMYGIMAIPLAAFIQRVLISKTWLKSIVAVLLVGLIVLNQFQMKQYRISLLHFDSITKEAYWGIFGKKTWPEGYDKMIKVPDYEKALKGEKEY